MIEPQPADLGPISGDERINRVKAGCRSAVRDEVLDELAVAGRPAQLAAVQFGRSGKHIAKPPAPRAAVACPEAELEEKLQVVNSGPARRSAGRF